MVRLLHKRSCYIALPSVPVMCALVLAATPAKGESPDASAPTGKENPEIVHASLSTALRPAGHGAAFQDHMLSAHNEERRRWNVPALKWNDNLMREARDYARKLTKMGYLQHSSMAGRNDPQGENLWMGTRRAFSYADMMNAFLDERRNYVEGVLPNISRTGNWHDTGHYSQIIWRTTTSVGCAVASSPDFDFLVCRYSPAGNIWGRRASDTESARDVAASAGWPDNRPAQTRLLMAYNLSYTEQEYGADRD